MQNYIKQALEAYADQKINVIVRSCNCFNDNENELTKLLPSMSDDNSLFSSPGSFNKMGCIDICSDGSLRLVGFNVYDHFNANGSFDYTAYRMCIRKVSKAIEELISSGKVSNPVLGIIQPMASEKISVSKWRSIIKRELHGYKFEIFGSNEVKKKPVIKRSYLESKTKVARNRMKKKMDRYEAEQVKKAEMKHGPGLKTEVKKREFLTTYGEPIEVGSRWDYDRSLCNSKNVKGLTVKKVTQKGVEFMEKTAYQTYGLEYFNGVQFKKSENQTQNSLTAGS